MGWNPPLLRGGGCQEDTPGPSVPDFTDIAEGRLRFRALGDPDDPTPGKLTLRLIREELSALVAQRTKDDPNLHYLDGLTLYGEPDAAALPLPDDLHPDAETHHHIGTRFADHVFTAKGAFAL